MSLGASEVGVTSMTSAGGSPPRRQDYALPSPLRGANSTLRDVRGANSTLRFVRGGNSTLQNVRGGNPALRDVRRGNSRLRDVRRDDYCRGTEVPPSCCEECALRCCWMTLAWCCVGRLSRYKRVEVLWVWLVFLALCSGVGVLYGAYGQRDTDASPTDVRVVDRGVSTVFCQGLSIDADFDFSAYLLDHSPRIDPHNRLQYSTTKQFNFFAEGDSTFSVYYLLQDSNVTISSCLAEFSCVDLYLIKGERNYKRWGRHSCPSCYETVYTFTSRGCVNVSYSAAQSDTYYFVHRACTDGEATGKAEFHLDRTVYDVTDATYTCSRTSDCDVTLDLDSDQSVVWQAGDFQTFYEGERKTVQTACQRRMYVAVLFFFLFPLILGISLTFLICKVCKDPPADRGATPGGRRSAPCLPDERSPLLGGGLTPGVVTEPPKYEDICRNRTPPPTYEEAITSERPPPV